MRVRELRAMTRVPVSALLAGGSVLLLASPAFAGGAGFTPGDLVIYQVAGNTSSSSAVSLVDYSTAGVPSGYSVALPMADNAATGTYALTESGSALNDGELTDAADGESLIATGYDAAPGASKITSATGVARTVAIVGAGGTVDTSTSLSDGTTEANNFRSATMDVTGGSGSTIWVGDGGGAGVTTDGATSVSYLDSNKVHEVQIVGGQLYESTTKNIYQVGTGLPTSGTPTETALLSGANLPANFGPDQFALVTLGSGPGPDTLYVADGSNGATSGEPNAVEKYSLENGVWTATGSVQVPLAAGLAVSVSNGVASIYVTGATSTSASYNSVLYGITDSSGYEGVLSGTATVLANAPSPASTPPSATTDDWKGLAWAPVAAPVNTPEVPVAISLPALGTVLLGGYLVLSRRRRAAVAAA